jgi:hypothetical protein
VLVVPLPLPTAAVVPAVVAAVVAELLLLSIARTAHPIGHVHVLHSVLRSVAADLICVPTKADRANQQSVLARFVNSASNACVLAALQCIAPIAHNN